MFQLLIGLQRYLAPMERAGSASVPPSPPLISLPAKPPDHVPPGISHLLDVKEHPPPPSSAASELHLSNITPTIMDGDDRLVVADMKVDVPRRDYRPAEGSLLRIEAIGNRFAAQAAPPPPAQLPDKEVTRIVDGIASLASFSLCDRAGRREGIMKLLVEVPTTADMQKVLAGLEKQGWKHYDLFDKLTGPQQGEFIRRTSEALTVQQKVDTVSRMVYYRTPENEKRAIAVLMSTGPDLEKVAQGLAGLKSPIPLSRVLNKNLLSDEARINVFKALQPSAAAALDGLKGRVPMTDKLVDQLLILRDPATSLEESIDQKVLFEQAIKDLADPTAISQERWGTCGGTAIQMSLAMRAPDRYIEILRHLAHKEPDNAEKALGIPNLRRPKDQHVDYDLSPEQRSGSDPSRQERSWTTRLMSPALMNCARGGLYKQEFDGVSTGRDSEKVIRGLTTELETKLMRAVFKQEVTAENVSISPVGDPDRAGEARQTMDKLNQKLESGLVPIGMKWGAAHHAVLYAGTYKDPLGGREPLVLLVNPWGKTHTMPMQHFLDRLESMHTIPPGQTRPAGLPPTSINLDPLPRYKYMTNLEMLKATPTYGPLGNEGQKQLREFCKDFVPNRIVVHNDLAPMLGNPLVTSEVLPRLRAKAETVDGQAAKTTLVSQQLHTMALLLNQPAFNNLPSPEAKRDLIQLVLDLRVPPADQCLGALVDLAVRDRLSEGLVAHLKSFDGAQGLAASIQNAAQLRDAPINALATLDRIIQRHGLDPAAVQTLNRLGAGDALNSGLLNQLGSDPTRELALQHLQAAAANKA